MAAIIERGERRPGVVHGPGSQPPPSGPNAEPERDAGGGHEAGEGLDSATVGRAALAVSRDLRATGPR